MATKNTTNKTNTTTNTNLNIEHVYTTQNGLVIGRSKGEKRYIKTRNFTANSMEELDNKIQTAFQNNSLDEGLELTEVIAVGFEIVDVESVEIDGKTFYHHSVNNKIYGDIDFFENEVQKGYIIDTCPNIQ